MEALEQKATPNRLQSVTLIGGNGFIGRQLAKYFARQGVGARIVGRGDVSWRDGHLGKVFYCAGMTADFRVRPFDTVDAHVALLSEILRSAKFSSFVYLSSTRVYARASSTTEDAAIPVLPGDPSDLYNISKLAGEALCLSSGLANVNIARLSNVFGGDTGSQNFLTSIVRDALSKGHIELGSDPASVKDYISVTDVVRALDAIGATESSRIFNVASGRNTAHGDLVRKIAQITGCTVSVSANARLQSFPVIDVTRIQSLIGPVHDDVLDNIEAAVSEMRAGLANSKI